MKYSDIELIELQNLELDILKEIIRICELYNLQYFTACGTTAGAVLYEGFIPWDDDIDIGLKRDDYEKFLEVAPKELKDDYYLLHYSVEKKTPTYHAKVMKRGTQFVEDYATHIKLDLGIFIDIMPFDYIPTDEKELKVYRRNVKFFHQLFVAKSVFKPTFAKGSKKILFTFLRTCLHLLLLPVPKDCLYQLLQKSITQYNAHPTGRLSSRGLEVHECDESDIFPTLPWKFSTLNVNIPREFDKVLSHQYGNYKTIPDSKDKSSHRPVFFKL